MKSLVCVAIGDGSVFGMKIDEKQQVWELKEMIKGEKMYNIPADRLTLYLAKKADPKGTNWLTTDDPQVQQLENNQIPEGIKALITEKEKKRIRAIVSATKLSVLMKRETVRFTCWWNSQNSLILVGVWNH